MEVYTIRSVHPQYGNVPGKDRYIYKWNACGKVKVLVISQVLHWQGQADLYRDTDGKIRQLHEIAARHQASIE